jgi:hypothetical protein
MHLCGGTQKITLSPQKTFIAFPSVQLLVYQRTIGSKSISRKFNLTVHRPHVRNGQTWHQQCLQQGLILEIPHTYNGTQDAFYRIAYSSLFL